MEYGTLENQDMSTESKSDQLISSGTQCAGYPGVPFKTLRCTRFYQSVDVEVKDVDKEENSDFGDKHRDIETGPLHLEDMQKKWMFCFKDIDNPALPPMAFKSPVEPSEEKTICRECWKADRLREELERKPKYSKVYGVDGDSNQPSSHGKESNGDENDEKEDLILPEPCAELDESLESNCCSCYEEICPRWCQNISKHFSYLGSICARQPSKHDPGLRKYNSIWTGQDNAQIGIFIRNMSVLAVDPTAQTISLNFYLNVVWLDEEFCDYMKSKCKKKQEDRGVKVGTKKGDRWIKQFEQEFINAYKEYLSVKGFKGKTSRWTREKAANILPKIRIWKSFDDGVKSRESTVSLNKKHIGDNTVYWRRLLRVKVYCDFNSKSFPFGYESFKLKIRLVSYTNQHLVLLRTKLWWTAHCQQQNDDLIPNHTFAYICPDNKLIKDWKVCSVHDLQDKFYSRFDNNALHFRLPVRVTRGMDTQSCFETLIIMKRRPHFMIMNSWIYFTLTAFVALLTWALPQDNLEGRLAIAIGVIFVQMGLRNDLAVKTARVVHITCLDFHIMISISLVVLEAFIQAILVKPIANGLGWSKTEASFRVGLINAIVVLVMNIVTYVYAKRQQTLQRKRLEKKVVRFAGFNEEPLGKYRKGKIGESVRIAAWKQGDRLELYDKELRKRVKDFKLERQVTRTTHFPGVTSFCCCCCRQHRSDTRYSGDTGEL